MRFFFTALLIVFQLSAFSVNKYWVGGNDVWDATAGTKWSLTSGGAGGSSVPTSSDAVFFDANSGTSIITVSGIRSGLTLTCTGFTGELTGSGTLTISGSVTFVATMTISVTGTLVVNLPATLTSGGKIWTGNLNLSMGASASTLADDWTVNGTLTMGTIQLNNNTLYAKGNITASGGNKTGTTTLHYNGTSGTWSGAGFIALNFNIDGDLIISGTVSYGLVNPTQTLTYISGIVTTTGSTLLVSSSILDIGGVLWNNVSFSNPTILTLLDDITCTGNLTSTSTANISLTDFSIIVGGNVNFNSLTTGVASGSTVIIANGAGNISMTGITTGRLACGLTVSSTANYSFASNIRYGGGTFTIESGATLNTSTFELNIVTANTSLDFNSYAIGKLHIETAGITVSLISEVKVSSNFVCTAATEASHATLTSISGTQKFTLGANATQDVDFLNVTNVDAGDGQKIGTWHGVLTNANNFLAPSYPIRVFCNTD